MINVEKEVFNIYSTNFLWKLVENFEDRRIDLLKIREKKREEIEKGILPNFLENTKEVRINKWVVSKVPNILKKRHVEIMSPPDRKSIINALNSEADCYMCDFGDSLSPNFDNIKKGHINLYDAIRKNIVFRDEEEKKIYQVNDYKNIPIIFVRPRGIHLEEKNIDTYCEKKICASLFDFAYYFFNNVSELISMGRGPYFYLPKLENHYEARWWNDIFNFSEDYFSLPRGTIRATVIIENILAAFEMDEILFELRHHSAGLNYERFNYIFSYFNLFKNNRNYLSPDRKLITLETHFIKSYVNLLIKTCHKRDAYAIGGMVTQIPIKNNDKLNEEYMQKVYNNTVEHVKAGVDGTCVAHPFLIKYARNAFENFSNGINNQFNIKKLDVEIDSSDLLKIPIGNITKEDIIFNIESLTKYIDSWINGRGTINLNNKIENVSTAELSRIQLWQLFKHKININDNKLDIKFIIDEAKKYTENKIVLELIFQLISKNNPPKFLTNYIINKIRI